MMGLPRDTHDRDHAGGGFPEDVFNRAAALEWVGGDLALLIELRDILLEECAGHLREIRQAVAHRDADALEHSAHTLKGSVANFCARAAAAAAFRLEAMGRDGDLTDAERVLVVLEAEIERLRSALAALEGDSSP
jgi:HPt (histidine-containing phosphotransfer) domain-containing protein